MQPAHDLELDRIFQALSDSTRRAVLRDVASGEKTVTELAAPHSLTFAAVSKHLKVLEAAELIRRRKSGSFQMIALNPEALKSADQWFEFYQKFWAGRLADLKTLLEKTEDKS